MGCACGLGETDGDREGLPPQSCGCTCSGRLGDGEGAGKALGEGSGRATYGCTGAFGHDAASLYSQVGPCGCVLLADSGSSHAMRRRSRKKL
jgi:hypothetical protein